MTNKLKTARMGNSPLAQKMMQGSGMPGYDKGGPVKKDGYLTDKKGKPYARVHKGEKVVPAKSKEAAKIKLREDEMTALTPPSLRRNVEDTRSREQVIRSIHKNRKQMKNRSTAGKLLSAGGLTAAIGSYFPRSNKAQAGLAVGGLAAALAGMGASTSARSKAVKLNADKVQLLRKIREERGGAAKSKAASVDFAVGLRIASGTLYGTYMDKTAASPMLLANIGKALSGYATKATPHVTKAWNAAKSGGRAVAEGIEGGAKTLADSATKTFPNQAAKWAELLKKNPELANTLSSAKKNWKPLAGGAAAGGLLMSGD